MSTTEATTPSRTSFEYNLNDGDLITLITRSKPESNEEMYKVLEQINEKTQVLIQYRSEELTTFVKTIGNCRASTNGLMQKFYIATMEIMDKYYDYFIKAIRSAVKAFYNLKSDEDLFRLKLIYDNIDLINEVPKEYNEDFIKLLRTLYPDDAKSQDYADNPSKYYDFVIRTYTLLYKELTTLMNSYKDIATIKSNKMDNNLYYNKLRLVAIGQGIKKFLDESFVTARVANAASTSFNYLSGNDENGKFADSVDSMEAFNALIENSKRNESRNALIKAINITKRIGTETSETSETFALNDDEDDENYQVLYEEELTKRINAVNSFKAANRLEADLLHVRSTNSLK